jgi:hypothetical protein
MTGNGFVPGPLDCGAPDAAGKSRCGEPAAGNSGPVEGGSCPQVVATPEA